MVLKYGTVNPFVIDRPAPAEDLIDRAAELAQLADLMEGGHNTRLVAPRRYGKTTLLRGLQREISDRGLRHVYVDLFGIVTLADVAARLDKAYSAALQGPVASWYATLRRRWRFRAQVGVPGTGVGAESVGPEDALRVLPEILDLPLQLFERDGIRTVVLLDEFQEILAADNAADAVIRSSIQHHGAAASYVFAGSSPGLLAELFGDRERPLYGQSREVKLTPLGDADLAEYIEARFGVAGLTVAEVMGDLLDLVRGHPQRAMLLAHQLWEVAEGRDPTIEDWEAAVAGALGEMEETFERYWERLSANERRVMTAVAWIGPWGGGTTLLGVETLARFKLSKTTARTVSRQLGRAGDIHEAPDGRPELVDPLLEAWIASDRRPTY